LNGNEKSKTCEKEKVLDEDERKAAVERMSGYFAWNSSARWAESSFEL